MIKLHLKTFPVRDALFSNMGYPQTEVTEPHQHLMSLQRPSHDLGSALAAFSSAKV